MRMAYILRMNRKAKNKKELRQICMNLENNVVRLVELNNQSVKRSTQEVEKSEIIFRTLWL